MNKCILHLLPEQNIFEIISRNIQFNRLVVFRCAVLSRNLVRKIISSSVQPMIVNVYKLKYNQSWPQVSDKHEQHLNVTRFHCIWHLRGSKTWKHLIFDINYLLWRWQLGSAANSTIEFIQNYIFFITSFIN